MRFDRLCVSKNESNGEMLRQFMSWEESHWSEKTKVGDSEVSTTRLPMNHGFGTGPDLWYETMVFGGDNDGYCRRYTTEAEAKEGHDATVQKVKDEEDLDEDYEV